MIPRVERMHGVTVIGHLSKHERVLSLSLHLQIAGLTQLARHCAGGDCA